MPNTVISSSAMNSDLSDIATALTGSLARDGQGGMTAVLPLDPTGFVYTNDINTGMYRTGADTQAIKVGGTDIVSITSAGIAVTGTLSTTGLFSPTGQITASGGTVLLPDYSFVLDTDSGMYRIGANNIGISVNAAKVLDISTSGLNVVGTVLQNGSSLSPFSQGVFMVNGTIAENHAGNAVTFSIKTLAGTDPSSTDPVTFGFRNATAATGDYAVVQVTAALSITISSGSTLGFSSGVAGKLWFVVFNDSGTVRLGVINCLSGNNIYPLAQIPIASSTAEGGAGGADSAQVFYTQTAVTSKAYSVLGYASYESGLVTAGAWAVSPTRVQLHGVGDLLPCSVVQGPQNYTGAVASGTTVIPEDDTIPQNTEGDQYMTQSIIPTSAANLLRVHHTGYYTNSGGQRGAVALFRDSTASAIAVAMGGFAANFPVMASLDWSVLAGSTSSTTFNIRMGAAGNTNTFNGVSGSRLYGGAVASNLRVEEIIA